MKHIEKELRLDHAGVDMASETIRKWLDERGLDNREILRIQLTMEELLLRISQHYGGNISGTLLLGKRFSVPTIRFRYRAESFDPTTKQDDEIGAWTDRILSHMGLSPTWSYRFGHNELVQKLPARGMPSWATMLIALSLAILLGIGGMALPVEMRSNISFIVLEPLEDIFMRLLSVFVGPIIFLSILNGICGMGTTADFGRLGKYMLVRYIGLNYINTAVMIMTFPIFALRGIGTATGGDSQLINIRNMLLDFIPSNLIKPFSEANVLQIVFLAAFLGIVILGNKEKSQHILNLAYDLYDIVMISLGVVCKMLPLYIFASITLQIWVNGVHTITSLWKPILLGTIICAVCLIVKITIVHFRHKVKISVLLRKILPTMIIGFTTASGAIAYSQGVDVNENKLGISPQLSRVGLSIGSILYCSNLSILFVLAIYSSAETYGVFGGIGWLVTAWVLCPILSFATPPVAGGALACVGILFAQFGIPQEALATASILLFLLDFVCTGFGLGMRHLELVLQAGHHGLLDTKVLRK